MGKFFRTDAEGCRHGRGRRRKPHRWRSRNSSLDAPKLQTRFLTIVVSSKSPLHLNLIHALVRIPKYKGHTKDDITERRTFYSSKHTLLQTFTMVATKIYKKCSPNGQLYLYLGQRDFISSDGLIEDIKGIAYVPELSEIQGE